MSPSEAFLGYRLPREGEWEIPEYMEERRRQQTRPSRLENMIQRQLDFQTRWYNARERPQVTFQVGQNVMTREGAHIQGEIENVWSGPHIVTAKLSDEVYEVEKNGSVVIIHLDDLRPAPRGNRLPDENEGTPEEPEEPFPGPPEPLRESPPESPSEPTPEPLPETLPESPPKVMPKSQSEHEPEPPPGPPPVREISGPTYIHRGRPTRLVVREPEH